MPRQRTGFEEAIADLKMVKMMLYFLGLARNSDMEKDVVTGVFSNTMHLHMQTGKTLPELIVEQECPNKPMPNKWIGHVLRNLPDRLVQPGLNYLRWEIAKPDGNVEFGPCIIDERDFLFVNSPVLEHKLGVLHAAATKAGKVDWEKKYEDDKAATLEKYMNEISPVALLQHAQVELQEGPYVLFMPCLMYLHAMPLLCRQVAVRIASGEFFVTRDAPGTKEWRRFYNYRVGRDNLRASYGQLSAGTKEALQVSTVRTVMDDLLFRSQPPA